MHSLAVACLPLSSPSSWLSLLSLHFPFAALCLSFLLFLRLPSSILGYKLFCSVKEWVTVPVLSSRFLPHLSAKWKPSLESKVGLHCNSLCPLICTALSALAFQLLLSSSILECPLAGLWLIHNVCQSNNLWCRYVFSVSIAAIPPSPTLGTRLSASQIGRGRGKLRQIEAEVVVPKNSYTVVRWSESFWGLCSIWWPHSPR